MENSYPVIGEPPVAPAVNVIANLPGCPTTGATELNVGASGLVAGVMAAEAGLHSPFPTELIALMRKKCAVPFVRPVTVAAVAEVASSTNVVHGPALDVANAIS